MSEKWYFCLTHKTVEAEQGCPARDRLGPYDSQEKAAHALEIAEARSEEWDTDPDWNDDVDEKR